MDNLWHTVMHVWFYCYLAFIIRKIFVDIMLRKAKKFEEENNHGEYMAHYYKNWRAYLMLNTWWNFRKLRKKSYIIEAL